MNAPAGMPERIGRFHLRSMLGRGAMGVVYLGHDEEIDRLVAIKLIRADLLDTEERESYVKRFRNEAKIAGRCVHTNIVGLYDFALHEGNPYLVMEYVNGVGLQQYYPRGTKRSVPEVIHIALQVLDALHYAHGRGIVHRDIKPANILISGDASLKITDFGISRLTSMELTATPLLIGTPSYMSPEQCMGAELDGRNDLFSLGCVLYELLAGERAFSGVNYTETIFAIANKPHQPLDRHRDDLPRALVEAIDRALSKKPDDRFADATAFAAVLDAVAREAGVAPGTHPVVIADAIAPVPPQAGSALPPGAADEEAPLAGTMVAPLPEPTAPVEAATADPPPAAPPPSEPPPAAVAPPAPTLPPAPVAGFAEEELAAFAPDDNDATLIRPMPGRPATPVTAASFPPEGPPTEPGLHIPLSPPPAPLDAGARRHLADCLAAVMGPIAPLLVDRAARPGRTREAVTADLAAFVREPGERSHFLSLVGRRA